MTSSVRADGRSPGSYTGKYNIMEYLVPVVEQVVSCYYLVLSCMVSCLTEYHKMTFLCM